MLASGANYHYFLKHKILILSELTELKILQHSNLYNYK